jgi:hypothetical protein
MKTLDTFMSRLMPWVAGCPDPLARQALVDSAIEFCEETGITQLTVDPQSAVAGQGTYDMSVPSDHAVVVTKKVWYGTRLLEPAATTEIDTVLAYVATAGTTTPMTGAPSVYYEITPGVVGLYPVPDTSADNMISARVATKPTRSATSLDDILFNDWVEAIVAGARKRLHAMPAQFYSDDGKAMEQERVFRYYINRAKGISTRGRVQGSISVRFNEF